MNLRIALTETGGEKHVPEELMEQLMMFGQHRQVCDDCGKAWETKDGSLYCRTGVVIWDEILKHPSVTVEP